MPVIKCKGIASLVYNDPNKNCCEKDKGNVLVISQKLAKQYIQQCTSKKIPVFLEHNPKYKVGLVNAIEMDYVDSRSQLALFIDFEITNEKFIKAIQTVAKIRMNEINQQQYMSSDNFVHGGKNSNDAFDMTAYMSLLQRLPGLSLGHISKDLSIYELSLCVAGKRDSTLITEAHYYPDIEGEIYDEEDYMAFLAGLHTVGNGERINKVTRDMNDLNIPEAILAFSKGVIPGNNSLRKNIITEPVMEQPNQITLPEITRAVQTALTNLSSAHNKDQTNESYTTNQQLNQQPNVTLSNHQFPSQQQFSQQHMMPYPPCIYYVQTPTPQQGQMPSNNSSNKPSHKRTKPYHDQSHDQFGMESGSSDSEPETSVKCSTKKRKKTERSVNINQLHSDMESMKQKIDSLVHESQRIQKDDTFERKFNNKLDTLLDCITKQKSQVDLTSQTESTKTEQPHEQNNTPESITDNNPHQEHHTTYSYHSDSNVKDMLRKSLIDVTKDKSALFQPKD